MNLPETAFRNSEVLVTALQGRSEEEEVLLAGKPCKGFGKIWRRVTGRQRTETMDKIQKLLADAVEVELQERFTAKKGLRDFRTAIKTSLRVDSIVDRIFSKRIAKDHLTVGAVKGLFHGFREDIVAVKIASDNRPSQALSEARQKVQPIVDLLLGEKVPRLGQVSAALVKAALIKRDSVLMGALRDALQEKCMDLRGVLETAPDSDEGKIAAILVNNIVSLFPFTEPPEGWVFQIPQKVNNKWKSVNFITERIPLTPSVLGSEYCAWGLKPVNDEAATPILVFMGTTHPTATGARFTVWSDFTPFAAVGELIFKAWGKQRITTWLNTRCPKPPIVTGMSLGGSLALLTAAALPDKVAEVQAYSPPALRQRHLDAYTSAAGNRPNVQVYCQENDLVPKVGVGWHKDWDVYEVIPEKPAGRFFAHAKIFAAASSVAVMKVDPTKENKSWFRKIFDVLHEVASLVVFPLITLYLFVRAIGSWIYDVFHWLLHGRS